MKDKGKKGKGGLTSVQLRSKENKWKIMDRKR